MKRGINFKELREIKKKVLEGVKLENSFKEINKIAGFDLAFVDSKVICGVCVIDYKTMEVVETKQFSYEIEMNYYPEFVAFREGPPIISALKELENQPDVLVIDGNGFTSKKRLGLATYVGVMLNKSTIGVTRGLIFETLDVDKIMCEDKQVGLALRTKEFANPIFVVPGYNIDIDTAVAVIKKTLIGHKMPEPLHAAHNVAIKEKKKIKELV